MVIFCGCVIHNKSTTYVSCLFLVLKSGMYESDNGEEEDGDENNPNDGFSDKRQKLNDGDRLQRW